ncbi:YfjI family protein [Variovorax boronicumulans]|uniref:YfjI family protein n=1 Tax=Variovorax boronicumulans TaxID=436515 RepID=UPI00132FF71E|nr:YfjI family protein [Variovorax boronicumulans]
MNNFSVDLLQKLNNREAHTEHPPKNNYHHLIQGTINEVSEKIQSPIALITSSILSVLSIACQARRTVIHPSGQISPLSLYFFTLAASGERKTATDALLMKPVREFQRRFDLEFQGKIQKYKADLHFWNQQKRVLEKKIDRCLRDEKTENLEALRYDQEKILGSEPIEPKGLKLQIDNTTSAAFLRFFDKYQPTTSIISDEGASALASFATANVGNLNNSWNGKSLSVERTSSESFTIENPRLTVHLMLQPEIFLRALKKENNIWEESGLLARSLFSFPQSKIGTRKPPSGYEPVYGGLDAFNGEIGKLLDISYSKPLSEPIPPMRFSAEAAKIWSEYSTLIENFMIRGGPLESIRAMASKVSENIARMAAIFECFSHPIAPQKITRESVMCAIDVCQWYLVEHYFYFSRRENDPIEKNAELLLHWLNKKAMWNSLASIVPKKLIAKNATPHFLRRSSVWQPALDYLEHVGKVSLEYPLPTGEEWIVLTPAHDLQQQSLL